MKRHQKQNDLLNSQARFITVPAGRRSGKTEALLRHTAECSIGHLTQQDGRYILAAPTHRQAKDIFWKPIKALVPQFMWADKPSETDLIIRLKNGVEICVMGMEAPQRAEGSPILGIGLDEYGNMKPEVWTNHVQPALNDPMMTKLGWAWFIGVPEGRNHYYDLVQKCLGDTSGQWKHFTWHSSEILPAAVIAQARLDLDELTFKQEYEASFVSFEGQAYYPFKRDVHAAKRVLYNPMLPLVFCFDFNVAPGVAVVCQDTDAETNVIGEVYIEQNSNTPMVCRKLLKDWSKHRRDVLCYGDATGGSRGTAKVMGSDWDLIKNELRPHFGDRLKFRVDASNPNERPRVNSVNCRLMTTSGQVKMYVDPVNCPHVIKDLEGVRLIKGSAGEIDKKSDETLTHLTDALGYFIHRKHPLGGHVVATQAA